MSEIWEMGAVEIARRIRSRELSSREAVEAHLRRIEAVNPKLNAVTQLFGEEAVAAAEAADRALKAGQAVGPLCGVPITVKEDVAVGGSATTRGLVARRNAIATRDAPYIAELRAAGAIPVGRTNMPEFGMRWHTDNALHGATRNPWAADLTPGGSSGGEAAALAAGMTPLGLGSDGAGSLRWPAQCCGVAALKPSHGRVPVVSGDLPPGPIPFAFQLLGVHGPMARRIADLRLAFRHMCSSAGGDPWHVSAPFEGRSPDAPFRVALISDSGSKPHPALAGALTTAARLLAEAGYIIEEREAPFLVRSTEIYTQIMDTFSRTTAERQPLPPGLVSPAFERFWAGFTPHWQEAAGERTHDPMMERATIARAWSDMMEDTPLLLAPISSQPAWKVGADLEPEWGAGWMKALRTVVAVNLLGLPAVAVPVAVTEGVPQAVQIIGPRFREDLCLTAAEAIELRLPRITPINPRLGAAG
jgi:amidase